MENEFLSSEERHALEPVNLEELASTAKALGEQFQRLRKGPVGGSDSTKDCFEVLQAAEEIIHNIVVHQKDANAFLARPEVKHLEMRRESAAKQCEGIRHVLASASNLLERAMHNLALVESVLSDTKRIESDVQAIQDAIKPGLNQLFQVMKREKISEEEVKKAKESKHKIKECFPRSQPAAARPSTLPSTSTSAISSITSKKRSRPAESHPSKSGSPTKRLKPQPEAYPPQHPSAASTLNSAIAPRKPTPPHHYQSSLPLVPSTPLEFCRDEESDI